MKLKKRKMEEETGPEMFRTAIDGAHSLTQVSDDQDPLDLTTKEIMKTSKCPNYGQ